MNLLNSRRRTLFMALPALAMLSLSACSQAEDKPAGPKREFGIPASQPVTADAIRQDGRGFTVGQQMNLNEIFVFFDPKCPHCAMFWIQSEALRNSQKFTWVPVAFMGKGSATEGAAILAAEDKVKAMTAHATQVVLAMRAGTRLPTPVTETGDKKHLYDIERNTRLLTSFGADSVPYIVAVNGNGKTVFNGSGVSPEQVVAAINAAAAKQP